MKRIKTLLIGATCFSVGYAMEHKDCLILEKGVWACSDFSSSLYASVTANTPTTAFGKQFVDTLKNANLLNEQGEIHVLPIADVLCDIIVKQHISVRFEASFISANKRSGGYEVVFFTREGFEKILCEKIIDTRSYENDGNSGKFYCASVKTERAVEGVDGLTFLKESVGGFILKQDLSEKEDYPQAREKILRAIQENGLNVSVYAFAEKFGFYYDKPLCVEKSENYFFVPSLSFGNILAAFENGILFERGKD